MAKKRKTKTKSAAKKGAKQDKAPEEEVSSSPLHSLRLRMMSMTASHGPARCRRAVSASRRTSTPPAPVDDRGRRRDRDSSFTDVGAAKQCRKVRGRDEGSAPHQWKQTLPLVSRPGLSPTPSVFSGMV